LFAAESNRTAGDTTEPDSRFVIPGIIALVFCGLFWPVIVFGDVMIGGDALYYSYPLRSHAWQIIKQGSLPLWTHSLFGGYPLFSMSQLALAYPLTWGYAFLPGHWAEQVYLSAPFLLCPAFTYLYVRKLGRSRPASLLAALSFAYGGFFIPGVNGLVTNGAMWLPLVLLGVERARTNWISSFLLITAAYALSILNGLGQVFLYLAIIAVVYSAFISFLRSSAQSNEDTWTRYRPVLVTISGILIAAGLTAFQTLETLQAVRLSVRQELTYQTFTEGSFTLFTALKSFIAPRFEVVDAMSYVPMLTALLALVAVLAHLLKAKRAVLDPRIFFWAGTAIVGAVLMLGANTPLYQLVFRLPLVNLFRVPARHSLEWTFALSVLSAYGWDTARQLLWSTNQRSELRRFAFSIGAAILTTAISIYWFRLNHNATNENWETSYLIVKVAFTFTLLISLWHYFKLRPSTRRTWLGYALIVLACAVEASILFTHLWYPNRKSIAGGFAPPSQATRFIQQLPAGRVYTDGPHVSGLFDSFNMVVPFGLQNVAGYEPAMLLRFSQALGNVGPDTSQIRSGMSSDGTLLEDRSHVLDILNTKYVTSFWDLGDQVDQAGEYEGIKLLPTAAPLKLRPRESFSLNQTITGDTLVVVSALSFATGIKQGEPVAKIRMHATDGSVSERVMQAGIDTAEWAHERPDIRKTISHTLATAFDQAPGDERNSFPAYRYVTRIQLPEKLALTKIEVINVSSVPLSLWKISMFDSVRQLSTPVSLVSTDRWRTIYNKDRVIVLENNRALPPAWLVSRVELVRPEEALRLIRGQEITPFIPKTTALVEMPVSNLSKVDQPQPSQPVRLAETRPNQFLAETDAEAPSLLVVSQAYYPGWIATVDQKEVPIYQTDYLLQGIEVPEGKHTVHLRYTAPAARRGLLLTGISALLLLVIGSILFYGRVRAHRI